MNEKQLRADNYARKMTRDDVVAAIKAIIKYYGDCRKASKELIEQGYHVTEHDLYHIKRGGHRDAVEEFMPLEQFKKLKEVKVRLVSETLVRNDGSVTATYNELKDLIPNINSIYIEKVLYKEKFPEISDEYFEKNQWKRQDYHEPGSALYTFTTGPDETWKDINYKDIKPNMYEVSNYGRVRNKKTGESIALIRRKDKYVVCHCMCINNFRKAFRIHQLVATAFIPNPLNKPWVNHKDLNPSNNYIKNLEWCTEIENVVHSIMNHKFTTRTHENIIRKKSMYVYSVIGNAEAARNYAMSHGLSIGISNSCDWIYDMTIETIRPIMNDLAFMDLSYTNSMYIVTYARTSVDFISVFTIPYELLEELTTYEIHRMFNGRALKIKYYGMYVTIVVAHQPLLKPYWTKHELENVCGVLFLNREIPYDVTRFIELIADKISHE